jgi:hypothetical protein
MVEKNLCFVRDAAYIHDVMMETTDEGKTKEAVIGITGIIGEQAQNQRIISRRLDRMEEEVKILQEGIKKIAAAVGVVL